MIIEQLPFLKYIELDGENWSRLKVIETSPRAYLDNMARDFDSRAMRVGRAAHSAILEPHLFESEYVVYPGKVRRGKEWDAYQVANADKCIVNAAERDAALMLRDAVHAHPVAKSLLEQSTHRELTVQWQDHETGLLCKARPDMLTPSALVDLKTTSKLPPHVFGKHAGNLRYHAQLAFYMDGIAANTLAKPDAVIIAVESAPPWDVVVYEIPDELIRIGRRHYRLCLNELAKCMSSNEWPGMAQEAVQLDIPDWALETRYDEQELVFDVEAA